MSHVVKHTVSSCGLKVNRFSKGVAASKRDTYIYRSCSLGTDTGKLYVIRSFVYNAYADVRWSRVLITCGGPLGLPWAPWDP